MTDGGFDLRAVAFDLDDTLLRDDLTISAETVETLREAAARGIHVIPASGRAFDSMLPFVRRIGCAELCIACNGAEIRRPDGTMLLCRRFPEETALRIVDMGSRCGLYMQTYDGESFYYNKEGEFARAYAASSMLRGELTPDLAGFIRRHPTPKILMMDTPARIAELLPRFRDELEGVAMVTCSKPHFLECNPPMADKGSALRGCAELLGFPMEGAAAFGDSLNDLAMLRAAGRSVAVANARPEVIAACDEVTGSNMEDGVARWLRRLWEEEPHD